MFSRLSPDCGSRELTQTPSRAGSLNRSFVHVISRKRHLSIAAWLARIGAVRFSSSFYRSSVLFCNHIPEIMRGRTARICHQPTDTSRLRGRRRSRASKIAAPTKRDARRETERKRRGESPMMHRSYCFISEPLTCVREGAAAFGVVLSLAQRP